MNEDMKALMAEAEKLGYSVVRYDEFEKTIDEVVKHRFMVVLEEKEKK